jgi:hypothetical protein
MCFESSAVIFRAKGLEYTYHCNTMVFVRQDPWQSVAAVES